MSSSEHAHAWKAQRLCRRVEEVLALAFAGCGDEVLLGVSVRSVAPAPSPGRLLVVVEAPEGDPAATLAALLRVQGRLRSEIASAIRRRRVPALVFRIGLPEA